MNKKFRKAIEDSYESMDRNKKDAFFAEIKNLSSYEQRETKLPVFYRFAAGAAGLAAALCVGVYLKNMPAPPDISVPEDMIVSETEPPATMSPPAVTDKAEKKTERHTTARPDEEATVGVSYTTAADIMATVASPQTQLSNSASTAVVTAATPTAVTIEIENGTETAAPESYYEYEGSFIMKKYTAFLASVVMLSNAASINTNATEYAPDTDYLYGVQAVKAYVEQNGESWLDLNSDGKFDIFDVYAFYSVDSSGIEECTVPDYIQQKHDSMPTADLDFTYGIYVHRSYGDREMDHYLECSYEGYIPGSYDIMDYFLAVKHPHAEYTDPNYYIDNCPDEYNDIIPHDLIRHDDGVWDIYELRKTQAFIREEDGQFRRITKDDVTVYETGYDPNFGHYANCTSLDSLSREKDIYYSRIHRFTEALRSKIYVTGTGSFVMKDLIEKGIIDADINSDGVFNFEDVALTAYTAYSVVGLESSYSLAEIALPDYRINEVLESEDFSNRPITREGKEKAFRLYETAAAYMHPSWRDIPVALAEYCVTSQETDPKFLDFDFYDENNYGFYRSYPVLENLALYEELSIRFGPSSEEIELPERMSFTRDEINEAFPEYYKNVKSGKLPEPDIDLDGKIDDADFNILFNLECEFSAPYKKDYLGVMVRRYPELLPVIGVSQEVRENFETNFDFNNNGISADLLETECMLMYIYGELDKNYADTQAFLDAQQAYFDENPDVQYYRVFNENHLWFSREHGKGWDGGLTANEELDSIVAAIAEFNTDMTAEEGTAAPVEEGTAAPATPGDANIDTRVNIADAVSVLQYVSNKTKYPMTAQGLANADCDGEAGITGSDASAIQRLDAGII